MKDNLISIARWILFIPGAFLCCRIVAVFVKAFPEFIERMDLGIVDVSVFIANFFNACVWGASFTVSGLWIAPKRNVVVLAVLSTILGIFCLFTTWLSWYKVEGGWSFFSIVVFNIFSVLSGICGGLMYLEDKK